MKKTIGIIIIVLIYAGLFWGIPMLYPEEYFLMVAILHGIAGLACGIGALLAWCFTD